MIAASGLESLLIFLVFIILSGVSTWLQKKRQSEEEPPEWLPPEEGRRMPPRPDSAEPAGPRRPRPAALESWEEELRRLLQGEPPRAPAPPPLPVPSTEGPASGPLRRSGQDSAPARVPSGWGERPVEGASGRLEDSARAYRQARALQEEAAERLRKAQAKTAAHQRGYGLIRRVSGREDIRAARALLASPRSARQAIIASVVLGTPRGLE